MHDNIEKNTNKLQDSITFLENKNLFIKTYGCQMNINDSYSIKALLKSFGAINTDNIEQADIIVINTCCVREKAEAKVYSYIGKLRKLKKIKDNLTIIITGCMSEQNDVKDEIFRRFPHVDIVLGTGMIDVLPQYIQRKMQTENRIRKDIENPNKSYIPLRKSERVSEFVTIMTGCNNYCSYCIVPYVRGRETSRNHKEILDEINSMVKEGCKEVTLLGQNVNSYGLDNKEIDFSELLHLVDKETDIQKIRFMTSHPKDITYKLLDTMAESQKMCKHIHLPLQSGSDEILKKMNRKYDMNRYYDIVDYARNKMPEIQFTTDIIVGFPGETEKNFIETLNAIEKVRFASAFMFKYSKRIGTPAHDMNNQVEEDIKAERLERLMELEAKIKKEVYNSYVGQTEKVLIESISIKGNTLVGKTDSSITVNLEGDKDDIGKILDIKITKAKTNTLFGQKVR